MKGNVKSITSRDNPLLAGVRKLVADPSGYRRSGEVWIEGDHLCGAYLSKAGVPAVAVITETGWQEDRLQTLASAASSTVVVPDRLMAGLSALESPPSIGFVVAWDRAATIVPAQPTVVLDRLQDAGNVGAILRSASAFGFRQAVALKGTVALWSGKVLRAGMGAHFGMRLVESAGPDDLEGLGVPLLATSSHASRALDAHPLPWPCAWVLGHEGQGVDERLIARCAASVRIPQPGGEESLNVAAAAAVCFYESARQRG